MKRLLLLSPVLLLTGCGGSGYRIDAPSIVEPGKPVKVALAGNIDGTTKVIWSAPAGGQFEGPVDQFTAIFISPNTGPVKLVCTVARSGAKTEAIEKEITVGGSTAVQRPSSAAPAAVAAAAARPLNIEDVPFVPSGFMGDISALKVDPRSMVQPHSPPYCQKWSYTPTSAAKDEWAAVAWQFPRNNVGDQPGRDFSSSGFQQVSVWVRGVADAHGILPKVQFKAGGNTKSDAPHKDSFAVEGSFEPLTANWREYTLDLRGQNLSNVVTAFIFVVRAQDVGPQGTTFYLDDIEYR